MDRSIGSPRTWSAVEVRGPGVSVFGLPIKKHLRLVLHNDYLVNCEKGIARCKDQNNGVRLHTRTSISYRTSSVRRYLLLNQFFFVI